MWLAYINGLTLNAGTCYAILFDEMKSSNGLDNSELLLLIYKMRYIVHPETNLAISSDERKKLQRILMGLPQGAIGLF